MEKLVRENFVMVFNEQERSVDVYILNEGLRRKLRTPMVFTYDGKRWIKTSGGRSVDTKTLSSSLGFDEEILREVNTFLREVGRL